VLRIVDLTSLNMTMDFHYFWIRTWDWSARTRIYACLYRRALPWSSRDLQGPCNNSTPCQSI